MGFMPCHMIDPPTKAIGKFHIAALSEASVFIKPSLEAHFSPVGGYVFEKGRGVTTGLA